MEKIKTTGFCEMTADEMQIIDGGLNLTISIIIKFSFR